MFGFLARRLLATLPVMLVVAVLVFLMLRLVPGDPAAVIAGDAASTEQIAQIRTSLGLDRSIPEQFVIWFGRVLTGDLGQGGVGPWLHHLLLPAITLAVVFAALIARVTRASVLETLGEDYIRTARAKGLPEATVLVRHALANAAVPIVTVIGIGTALLIGGVVVTESVYAIPGLGRLTVDAVLARDFPTIQGLVLLFSIVYVLVNLLVDLSYVFLDPRIRY